MSRTRDDTPELFSTPAPLARIVPLWPTARHAFVPEQLTPPRYAVVPELRADQVVPALVV